MTLVELHRCSGIAVSSLSKLENDKMQFSYGQLLKLSSGLGVDISELFGSAREVSREQRVTGRRSISRAGDGPEMRTKTYSYTYPATDLLDKAINPMVIEVCARSIAEFDELTRHPGDEYAYVIEGSVDFHSDLYRPVRLDTGDSIYFDGGMGHAYVAVAPGPCRILSICSPHENAVHGHGHDQLGADAMGHPPFVTRAPDSPVG